MKKDFSVTLLYVKERPFCGIVITVLQSSSESVKIAHNKAREREELSVIIMAIRAPCMPGKMHISTGHLTTNVWK